jgi:limonene-1,2-epoxide hydrolase
MADNYNLLDLVDVFQNAVKQKDVDKVLAMFTDDADFELVGISRYLGKEQIRKVFEYDAGVNSQLKFINRKTEENTVYCQLIERNDRLSAIGVTEAKFSSCTIVFRDGLIQNFSATLSPKIAKHNTEIWQKFVPWCKVNHPDEYSRIFSPDGKFIYNRKNGKDVVPLLRKWREQRKK